MTKKKKKATIVPDTPPSPAVKKVEDRVIRLLEPAVLLHALDPVRGEHIRNNSFATDSGELSNLGELQRRFLDAVAYICDTRRGGDTVTATALQDTGGTVALWLVSNTKIKQQTIDVVHDVLELAANVYGQSRHVEASTEQKLLEQIVELGLERVEAYVKQTVNLMKRCIQSVSDSQRTNRTTILSLLNRLRQKLENARPLHKVVRFCYDIARTSDLDILKRPLGDTSHSHPLSDVRHFICRLGKHLAVAKILLRTAKDYPRLLADLEICVGDSSAKKSSPLPRTKNQFGDIDTIIGHMFQGNLVMDYRQRVKELDSHYGLQLQEAVKENWDITTRVHAELILVDLFHREEFEFFGGVPYVGCSKPACYLCASYVEAHSMLSSPFELRGSHQKIYLAWRPPDFVSHHKYTAEDIKEKENILQEVIKKIRNDVKHHIDTRQARRARHPDSTSGVTGASFSAPHESRPGVYGFQGLPIQNRSSSPWPEEYDSEESSSSESPSSESPSSESPSSVLHSTIPRELSMQIQEVLRQKAELKQIEIERAKIALRKERAEVEAMELQNALLRKQLESPMKKKYTLSPLISRRDNQEPGNAMRSRE